MKNLALLAIVFVTNLLLVPAVFPEGNSNFPTHCKSDEYAYLNAKMARIARTDKGGYHLIKNGKLLSICVDRKNEPFGKMAYRYGDIGKVEIEVIATIKDKFGISYSTDTPRSGSDLIFFSQGKYNYYVSVATGQGSGVGLKVFKSGKQVLDLFSGNEQSVDFVTGLVEIAFHKALSPIFVKKEPIDSL